MLQSKLFGQTIKEKMKDEASINGDLLYRAGFISKLMSGVYNYLPLGYRVLEKIKDIVREEMNKIGSQELLMPTLQPKELWDETDRWEGLKDVMFQFEGRGSSQIGLATTHEEVITDIVRHRIHSYKDLPVALYQIQDKFRNEPRAKSGLLRGREFSMKDLYSFHTDTADMQKFYEQAKKAYLKIFERCGLESKIVEASGGAFTDDFSHEFQVLSETGEDTIIYCSACAFAQNKEICKLNPDKDACPKCNAKLLKGRAIEVGNIFPLHEKYSEAMNAKFTDKDGKEKNIIMGCYGLGPSRTMGAIVEIHHDDKGIIWPKDVAPFDAHLIALTKDAEVMDAAKEIYQELKKSKQVLFDDRVEKSIGEKLADADLIGIPVRVVVSKRTLQQESVELKYRNQDKVEIVKIKKLFKLV